MVTKTGPGLGGSGILFLATKYAVTVLRFITNLIVFTISIPNSSTSAMVI